MKKSLTLLLTSAVLLSACSHDATPKKEPTKEAAISKEEKATVSQFHPEANTWYKHQDTQKEEGKITKLFIEAVQKHVGIQTNIPLDVLISSDKQGSKGLYKDRFYWKQNSSDLPVKVVKTKNTPYANYWKDHDGYHIEAYLIANAESDLEKLNVYIHKNTFDILQEVAKNNKVNIDGITIRWKVPIYQNVKGDKKNKVTFQSFEDVTAQMRDIKRVKTIKDIQAPIQSYGVNGFFHKWLGSVSYVPEFDKKHKNFGKYKLYEGK
jgi:hypothetical protein